jgi:hypothetical protein
LAGDVLTFNLEEVIHEQGIVEMIAIKLDREDADSARYIEQEERSLF